MMRLFHALVLHVFIMGAYHYLYTRGKVGGYLLVRVIDCYNGWLQI